MSNEIERKFLVSKMPDLSNYESVIFERYYIYRDGSIEIRVQKKGEHYEIERKEMVNDLKAINWWGAVELFGHFLPETIDRCIVLSFSFPQTIRAL